MNPLHPDVDWSRTRKHKGRTEVWIVCSICGKGRFFDAGSTRYRIKLNQFSGVCFRDRLIGTSRRVRLERPPHPAVDWEHLQAVDRRTCVPVTCPTCGVTRMAAPGPVAAKIRDGGFTGKCLGCSGFAAKREWVVLGPGRKIDPAKGYVRLSREAITPADLSLFDAMRKPRVTFVFEHRFVMAKMLGRPLTTSELVDHMDGVKTNNDPANLRLYIRGRNMPGETNGYGTYYHEWQMALARIRELDQSLAV